MHVLYTIIEISICCMSYKYNKVVSMKGSLIGIMHVILSSSLN